VSLCLEICRFAKVMKGIVNLMREWWRQWSLLECPYCGRADLRSSTRRGPLEWALSRLSILPYRCARCQRRFYLLRRGASA
jgi:hypothetical protein